MSIITYRSQSSDRNAMRAYYYSSSREMGPERLHMNSHSQSMAMIQHEKQERLIIICTITLVYEDGVNKSAIFSYTVNTMPPLKTSLPNRIVLPLQNPRTPALCKTLRNASLVLAPCAL